MASDDCLSASLIRWRGPRGTPRACALGAAARQAPDHAACVPAQRRTGGLGAQAAHTGRDAPADRAALAGGRAQEQGRSQDVPSARHPSVKRRRLRPQSAFPSPGGLFSSRIGALIDRESRLDGGSEGVPGVVVELVCHELLRRTPQELMRERMRMRMSGSSQLESECKCASVQSMRMASIFVSQDTACSPVNSVRGGVKKFSTP